MIKITLDPYGLSEDDPMALVVRDESQFIESRLKIRDVLHKRKDLNVIIKNRKIGRWYESLKDYPDVKIETVSPSSVLSRALNLAGNLSLNLPINDSEIQELGLIEKAKENSPRTSLGTIKDIESWILSVARGECWSKEGGTLTHLSEIASISLNMREYIKHSALEKLIEKQKENWFNSSVGEAYKWLFVAPNDRAFLIYAWQVLRNYDKPMREKVLDEIIEHEREVLEPIEKYVGQIPSIKCRDDHEKKLALSDLLEIKWKKNLQSLFEYKKGGIRAKKHEALRQRFRQIINEAVMKMSGRIAGEINAILAFVGEIAVYFSRESFNLIGAKFTLFQEQIEKLSQFIPPEFPSEPMLNWDWSQISKWAINEYFPYKRWAMQQEKRDKRIEELAENYSGWLYKKYPELKNELSPLVYGTWYRIKEYIEQGYQILWVVIDSLCWFYIEDVVGSFKKQGLSLSSDILPMISMLPSETRFSKSSLIAGKLPSQMQKENLQKYSLLFEEFCETNNILDFRIIPPDKLENVLRREKIGNQIITCGMTNNPDVSMHKNFYGLERQMRAFFENIAEDIKTFLSQHTFSKRFLLIISTDHGSCVIPPNIKGLKEPKEGKIEKEHKRFVYLNSSHNLGENWYFLDKNKFGLPESIAIAKGYSFIGNRKPKGLIHGGMTPEETVIPHLEFYLQPLELKDIQCYHISSPIIGTRKQKVELAIRNLNNFEISKVTLYFPSHSIEINLEKITAKDEVTESLEIALSREEVVNSKDNIVTLKGFYSFDCRAGSKRGAIEAKIKIRKIIEGSETAEEIFKF
jgi:hypothetical protein